MSSPPAPNSMFSWAAVIWPRIGAPAGRYPRRPTSSRPTPRSRAAPACCSQCPSRSGAALRLGVSAPDERVFLGQPNVLEPPVHEVSCHLLHRLGLVVEARNDRKDRGSGLGDRGPL